MVSFWAVVAAFGIPSAFMGFVIWRLERKIEARDRAQEKKNQEQQKLFLLIVQGTRAATALGEATAHAMQRGHTNGDMEKALAYAADIKHKQKEFLDKQGIQALWDD